MTNKIAIIGAGAAGLHLGIYLRKNDIDVTIFTDRKPEEYASSKLLNTVAHHSVTIDRENSMGINHWPNAGYYGHYYNIGGEHPIKFYGDLKRPSRAVDYRIYLPTLMQDFEELGGEFSYEELTKEDLEPMSERFDLVTVCVGKFAFAGLFETNEAYSPFIKPQRALCVGLFKGIREDKTRAVTMSFAPGEGELIEIPTLSFNGMCTALVMENHFGGDMEVLMKTKYDDNPQAFLDLLLEKLKKHHPFVYERIDRKNFGLASSSRDILQGAVTPTLRQGTATLPNGKRVIALGDIHATVDPVLGQGANMATFSAQIIGEEIVRNSVLDDRFIEHIEARRADRVQCATRWTNFCLDALRKMPTPFMEFIQTMSQSREMANEFTDNFNYPEKQMDYFSNPDRIQKWCAKYS